MLRRLASIAALAVASLVVPMRAEAASWNAAAIVERDGNPVFEVDGKPFFVYGAAFFYERLPKSTWETSLRELRDRLDINTLDIYVPWNWHEVADGDFDFDGRTNPRRDLHEVLRLARALGFKIILRPGPVIRNEWRNGGYPAWLLARAEYAMPLRDILEGRYPATATLQNAHSDDAAAAWMRNATHRTYAKRWLERVLHEVEPDSNVILAVALDDDQGAYIDNATWPAPHLRAYLAWLRDVVHAATSATLPVFINTYEMKVTASSPVWAMGNWYQSDAFAIGEHDRSQLEFSTGLLHTRPHQPMMMSEFQAGWLQQPQDVLPQAADPSNTLLAMHTLVGAGVRGIVNFPAADSYDPAGWEAPFANAFYAWDAALGYDSATSNLPPAPDPASETERSGATREVPTSYVGRLVATFGPALASASVRADAAIAYVTSAYDPARLTNAAVATIAGATLDAQRDCRSAALACRLVDLRYADATELARYPLLVIPPAPVYIGAFAAPVRVALERYVRGGGIVVRQTGRPALSAALARAHRRPTVEDAGAAIYAEDTRGGAGFLTLENYDDVPRSFPHARVRRSDGSTVRFAPIEIAPRDALLLPVDVPLRTYVRGFARGAVLESSTCPVVALSESKGTVGLQVVRSLTNDAACTTRFSLPRARGAQSVSVSSHDARFALTPEGRIVGGEPTPYPLAPHAPLDAIQGDLSIQGGLPIRNDLIVEAPPARAVPAGEAIAYLDDVYRDGYPCVVLASDVVRLIISPDAGGRAFVFEDTARGRNAFDTIGALRDDVAIAPPPSETDRIAKYTHQFPAGFFNRRYVATILASGQRASVRLRYEAPDAFPNGGAFERVITLEPHARAFTVDASATFRGSDPVALAQRGVMVSSFVAGNPHATDGVVVLPSGSKLDDGPPRAFVPNGQAGSDNVAGLFDPATHDLVMQAWSEPPDGSRAGSVQTYARHETTSLALRSGGTTHITFAFETAATLDEARERLRLFGCSLAARVSARAPACK